MLYEFVGETRKRTTCAKLFNEFVVCNFAAFVMCDKNGENCLYCAIMRYSEVPGAIFTLKIYAPKIDNNDCTPLVFKTKDNGNVLAYTIMTNLHMRRHAGVQFNIDRTLKNFAKLFEQHYWGKQNIV